MPLAVILLLVLPVPMFLGLVYLGKYLEHRRTLKIQRHHVEWCLEELSRRRKDRDA